MKKNKYVNKKTGEVVDDIWDKNKKDYYLKYELQYVRAIKEHPEWYKKID